MILNCYLFPKAILANDVETDRERFAESDKDPNERVYELYNAPPKQRQFHKPNKRNKDLGYVESSWDISEVENVSIKIDITTKLVPVPGESKHYSSPIISLHIDMTDEVNDKYFECTFFGDMGDKQVDHDVYIVNKELILKFKEQSVTTVTFDSSRGEERNCERLKLRRNSKYSLNLESSALVSKHPFNVKTMLKLEFFDDEPNNK